MTQDLLDAYKSKSGKGSNNFGQDADDDDSDDAVIDEVSKRRNSLLTGTWNNTLSTPFKKPKPNFSPNKINISDQLDLDFDFNNNP